jgi:hypothetical protein
MRSLRVLDEVMGPVIHHASIAGPADGEGAEHGPAS